MKGLLGCMVRGCLMDGVVESDGIGTGIDVECGGDCTHGTGGGDDLVLWCCDRTIGSSAGWNSFGKGLLFEREGANGVV